jgi:hypothetical protein
MSLKCQIIELLVRTETNENHKSKKELMQTDNCFQDTKDTRTFNPSYNILDLIMIWLAINYDLT